MKLLFLSLLFEKEEEENLLKESKIGLQGAPNAFQWALVEGLDKNLESSIQLLNSLPIGTYPHNFKRLFIPSKHWQHCQGAEDINIGFVNLIGLKQCIRERRYIREIKKWINRNNSDNLYILTYDLYLPYLKALTTIKKKYPNIITCAVVTDLPNEFGFNKEDKGIFKYIRKRMGEKELILVNSIDKFVLLTDQMKYPLKIGNKPYVVIEGIINEDKINLIEYKNRNNSDKRNIVLYTGTLNKTFGIERLLTAFSQINKPNYYLWICGNGDMKDEIVEMAKMNPNVKYFGYVAHDEALRLQKKATILINPRTNDGVYTRYSFPSKTLEYLASGTPLVAYKLDGIPDEYDDFIYYVSSSSVEALKDKIIEVCEKDDTARMEFGKRAQEFVLQEKGDKLQASKIIELLQNF